jgi:hypothetical protein
MRSWSPVMSSSCLLAVIIVGVQTRRWMRRGWCIVVLWLRVFIDKFDLLLSTDCNRTNIFWLQEENLFLANSLDSVKQYSSRIQKIIGYCVSMPWLGWVNFQDPRELLNGRTEKGRIDTYSGGTPNY